MPVYPNHTDRSVFINQQALPYLIQETLQAQSAQHPDDLRRDRHELRLRPVAAGGDRCSRRRLLSRMRALAVEHIMGMPIVVDVRDDDVDDACSSRCSTGCAASTRPSARTRTTARSAASTAASSRSTTRIPTCARCSTAARSCASRRTATSTRGLRRRTCRPVRARQGLVGRPRRGDPRRRRGAQLRRQRRRRHAPARPRAAGAPAGASASSTRSTANAVAAVVEANDLAVATSGAYARGEHVLDPHTRRPPDGVLSVTITGPELATADAYATAAFAMGAAGPTGRRACTATRR